MRKINQEPSEADMRQLDREMIVDIIYDVVGGDIEDVEEILEYYLPHDIVEELQNCVKEDGKSESHVRGLLFEMLVRAEVEINRERTEDDDLCRQIERDLLKILTHPGRYGIFVEAKNRRVPDLTHFRVREMGGKYRLEILEVGEVKLGEKDSRTIEQLTAFREMFKNVLRQIPRACREQPGGELSQMKIGQQALQTKFIMSPDFKVVLHIPNGRSHDPEEMFPNVDDRAAFEAMVADHSQPKIEVQDSRFTFDQIKQIAHNLIPYL